MEQDKLKEISKKVANIFSKVAIKECTICGKFLSEKEYSQFEGVCKTHWDE